jgi:hypothetical protein
MEDQRLSTRDLANRSDADEAESSLQSDQPTTGVGAASGRDVGRGSAGSDAPLTRDPAADHSPDTEGPGTGTDPGAGDDRGHLDRASGGASTKDARRVDADHEPLFPSDQSERFTNRWQDIQSSFVDEPRDAVADADALVADLMQRLAATFSKERERLEAQWDSGDDVSTEDLRIALTRYRSFFDRLLSA